MNQNIMYRKLILNVAKTKVHFYLLEDCVNVDRKQNFISYNKLHTSANSICDISLQPFDLQVTVSLVLYILYIFICL